MLALRTAAGELTPGRPGAVGLEPRGDGDLGLPSPDGSSEAEESARGARCALS